MVAGAAMRAVAGADRASDDAPPVAFVAGASEAAAARASAGDVEARAPLPERIPSAAGPLERPADAATPAPVSDDMPQPRRLPREGTEAAHYRRFVALAARRDGSLEAAAGQVFGGTAPENERVALLRALWDSGSADAATWFGRALSAPGERASADAAVPEFALRFLSIRAPGQPAARTVLASYAATAPADCDPGRLARAAAALDETPAVASNEDP